MNVPELDWEFIEKHLPNYYSRADVHLSNRIAAFNDGSLDEDEEDMARHELTIETNAPGNITLEEHLEEFALELNQKLFAEAVAASGVPYEKAL